MKKNFLFISVLASLFIAGCSRDEIAPNEEDVGNGKANTSYIAVNLVSSDVARARASSGYQDGEDYENKVTKVRFYFFTENGAATDVKLQGSTYVNYYDWPNVEQIGGSIDTDDIESKLKATIVISTKSGDKLPQMMAAVLNPTTDLGNESKSLDDLKAISKDYASDDFTKEGSFVMFNSVYGNNGAEVCAVPVKAENLCKEESEAKLHPVTIYVERSVAKVTVSLGDAVKLAGTGKLPLKDKNGNALTADGKQVYLTLEGWALTAETDNSRLVKKINPAWPSDWWNGTHRSFWAMNSSNAKNKYRKYADIPTAIDTVLYTNENAAKASGSDVAELAKTKVILKGFLCNEDGSRLTLVRHMGSHYADTYSEIPSENLPLLKASILAQLKANGYNYYYGNSTTRTQIGTDDLQIVIAKQLEEENSTNNCYVYAQLTEVAKGKTWYNSADRTVTDTIKVDTINKKLKNKDIVDWALVWKSGMTYYYYEIIHNGEGENATKGVVRNHVYKTNVTKIAGFGTPVYDPEQEIYPEKPDPNDHYIAAEVKILSWRIVNNDYALDW
ncbi:Mfa1 family fimbria major subunit [uncultured Sanguibacteroides sp.]|uniref:Mfa1 family fimbria major subunit n=1 Tax=uncultured Sanguibacteroides sp. TaxID=1635151 RepID=UPI0025D24DF2|nr:Mfa1 family fimbria major subunit [uncultured Sanguibacteroides sp.]